MNIETKVGAQRRIGSITNDILLWIVPGQSGRVNVN